MNGCEHSDVMTSGVCVDCGSQVILTGQVPVREGVSGNRPAPEDCDHSQRTYGGKCVVCGLYPVPDDTVSGNDYDWGGRDSV